MDVAFRVNFGSQTGGGHLERALTLSRLFPKRPLIVVGGILTPSACERLRSESATWIEIPTETSFEADCSLYLHDRRFKHVTTFIFDVSNRATYEELNFLIDSFQELKECGKRVVVIDGLGSDSILSRVDDLHVDFVITPYVGAAIRFGEFKHLAGPDYFVLGDTYRSSIGVERVIRDNASRVLVTAGMSDPACISELALRALLALPNVGELQVKVVIGAGFSKELTERLHNLKDSADFEIDIKQYPSGLKELMQWADLAISASGLTKYELAATGTPTLTISHDEISESANEAFKEHGSVIHLGMKGKIAVGDLASDVRRVMADRSLRARLSHTGRALIDGAGSDRIIREIFGANNG
jgi:UDP-2,4-diacetamido-2,4,6-trideoxy-beta-L-altropyranose hydrolase